MNKIKKVFKLFIILLGLYFCIFNDNVSLNFYEQNFLYPRLKENYSWINIKLFEIIRQQSIIYDIDIYLICSIITKESNGVNLISRRNKNKTRDYGYMQINDVHFKDDPMVLLNPRVNIEFGCQYLKMCLNKSKGNIIEALRFYNQGIYGKKHLYNNWEYCSKIISSHLLEKN